MAPRITTETSLEKKPNAERQAHNIRAIKDAWFSLLLSLESQKREAFAEVWDLEVSVPGSDPHFSLDFNIHDYNPRGNINTELAVLALRSRYVDRSGQLKNTILSSLEIAGGPDEAGRIGLDIRYARTEPGYESHGFGQALTSLLEEAIPVLQKINSQAWKNKIVYVLMEDLAHPVEHPGGAPTGVRRLGWTRAQAQSLGFSNDEGYVSKFLGKDFLPLPSDTFVRVYQHPQL